MTPLIMPFYQQPEQPARKASALVASLGKHIAGDVTLYRQREESEKLDGVIQTNLENLGYPQERGAPARG